MSVRAVLLAILAWMAAASAVAADEAVRKVVLHLRWDHQFQFAGFYAAQWQGYYRNAGLEVDIRSAFAGDGSFRSATDAVTSGAAQFGIGAADVLTAIDAGHPLTVVMPVFQQSVIAFYSRKSSDIRSPGDLARRSVATRGSDGVAYPELRAMLRAEGVNPSSVSLTEARENPAILDLVSGRAEVASGSVLSAGWLAQRLGQELTALYPAAYGVDFYGDSVFVRRDFLSKNADLVRRFVTASTQGWQYALTQSDEIADRLARELPRIVPIEDAREFNRFQAAHVKRLTQFPASPIGHINPDRWRIMHDVLAEAGMVRNKYDEASMYDTMPRGLSVPKWALPAFIAVILAINVLLVVLVVRFRATHRRMREAETSRRAIAAQLEAFVENAPFTATIRDMSGRYLAINRRWSELTGLSKDVALGHTYWELVPANSPTLFANAEDDRRAFEQVVDSGQQLRVELEFPQLDGTTTHTIQVRFPIRDDEGRVFAIGTMMQDVSEQHRSEKAREAAEAQMRALVENAPLAISVRDMKGRYLSVNPVWEKYFLTGGEEIYGNAPWDIVRDPRDPRFELVQLDMAHFEAFVANPVTDQGEIDISTIDGPTRRFLRTRFPVRNAVGEMVAVGTVAHEVTDVYRVQREREALEAQLRAFIDHAPFHLTIRDAAGRYIICSRSWREWSGMNEKDVAGIPSWDLFADPAHPMHANAQWDKRIFEEILRNGKSVSNKRTYLADDGTSQVMSSVRFPIRDDAGRIIAVGNIMADETAVHTLGRERAAFEAQLQTFFDHAPLIVTIRDTEGRYLACNRAWEKWAGHTAAEALGKKPLDIVRNEHSHWLEYIVQDQNEVRECAMIGRTYDTEKEILLPSGEAIYMSFRRFPIRDESGNIFAVGTIMEDRSEIKKLGWAREQLETQLKAFIENAPIAVSIADTDGNYILANSSFFRQTETSPEGALKKPLREILPASHGDDIARMNREVIESGMAKVGEFNIEFPSGRKVDVSITKFPLRDHAGQIAAVGTFATDVTVERAATAAVENREARYRALVEMSPQAILVHMSGRVLFANAVARRFLQLNSEQDVANASLLDWIHPDDVAAIRAQIGSMKDDTSTVLTKDLKFRLATGSEFDVSVTSSPIEFDGKPARQLVIYDISERKRMEAQIVQNAKLATIGELSAGILHELAQPLNIARMAAQAALRKIRRGGKLDDPMQQFEMIESQMARMAGVIDHMRVFSRAEEPVEEIFDARNAIRSAVQMIKQPFASDEIEVELVMPKRRCFIKGRAIALEQVILNLLSNARDAIMQSTVPGRVSDRSIRIDLKVDLVASSAVIAVIDTGGGIPAHAFPRLFDPFFTTKPIGRGTGLGLPVCQSIVRAMRGELSAENTETGAKFLITLPLQSLGPLVEGKAEAPDSSDRRLPGVGRTALLVDDEAEALQLMADFFEELGFDVRTASNGEEGLRCFRSEPVDLVVTDIRLPVFDGIELAQHIRAQNPAVPIVFVTGHRGITESLDILGSQDSVRLLNKPIDLEQLERVVAQVIAGNTKVLAANTKN